LGAAKQQQWDEAMEKTTSRVINQNQRPTQDRVPGRIRLAKRLLRSRVAWHLARTVAPGRVATKPHDQVTYGFFLRLGQQVYADRSTPVIWSSIFVPSELLWGLGLVPFYPETAAGIGAALGLSSLALEGADTLSCPVDICTFNRSAAGLRAGGFFPHANAYIASTTLCDASSQMMAGFAHSQELPFSLLDVPQTADKGAVDYLTAQLAAVTEHWAAEFGLHFEPERLKRAIRLSNQARALALEVAQLRETQPAPLRGSSLLGQLAMLTSMFGHSAGVAYYRALRDYTWERIHNGQPEQENQKVRLYWMHLAPYYSASLLPHLEDELGGTIAFEEASTVWWEPLDEERPLRSLARKMLSQPMHGPIERRVELALRHIKRFQCTGAVHFSHWGCRQSTGALRVLRTQLRRAGIPLLVIDGDCVDPTNLQIGPLRTRLDAFIEMLAQ
jgi:benzoyl-CoA reductase/2-hydroxyglutaryl-CoA dehydratase subunit BcrC/BadD/HgdB